MHNKNRLTKDNSKSSPDTFHNCAITLTSPTHEGKQSLSTGILRSTVDMVCTCIKVWNVDKHLNIPVHEWDEIHKVMVSPFQYGQVKWRKKTQNLTMAFKIYCRSKRRKHLQVRLLYIGSQHLAQPIRWIYWHYYIKLWLCTHIVSCTEFVVYCDECEFYFHNRLHLVCQARMSWWHYCYLVLMTERLTSFLSRLPPTLY